MCGGGGSKSAAPVAPVNMGYTYSPADNSNIQRQKLAVSPDGKASTYGSELSAGSQASQGGN